MNCKSWWNLPKLSSEQQRNSKWLENDFFMKWWYVLALKLTCDFLPGCKEVIPSISASVDNVQGAVTRVLDSWSIGTTETGLSSCLIWSIIDFQTSCATCNLNSEIFGTSCIGNFILHWKSWNWFWFHFHPQLSATIYMSWLHWTLLCHCHLSINVLWYQKF